MRNIFNLLLLCSLLLSGCGTLEVYVETTPVGNSELPGGAVIPTVKPKLSLNSSSDEIQHALLESATQWKTIWMDGTVTQFSVENDRSPIVTREQVWIDLTTDRFRVVMGPSGGVAEKFITSDGLTLLEMDLIHGASQSRPMPELPDVKQFVPTLQPGYAYPQPLWGQMGTPLAQLAFASDFAQNEGTFKPVGTEIIAGRDALIVEWTYVQSKLPSWRMWLDVEKEIVLKMQNFDKGGGDTVQSEAVVNQVSFDDVFGDFLFGTPSLMPQFSDVAGQPLSVNVSVPTLSSEPDPLNDVYFFVSDHNYGNENVQLVRVPGSCVVGLIACPEAQVIPGPVSWRFNLSFLVWSPTREEAAFAYPISEDGNWAGLFLFDPQTLTWTSLASYNFIDPPMWSSDGTWLAFRVQDGQGLDEIHAVRRDGSGLMNISANEQLPEEGRPYVLNGWISNNIILRGRNDMVYIVRADDRLIRPLFDTPWAKSDFVPSPDGYFLAYMDVNDERAVLKLLTPDGKTTRELATFEKSSLYPIVWSPDGTQLVFGTLTNEPSTRQDLYLIKIDRTNLRQVYHSTSASIMNVNFSPDGKYLLIQDDDATGRHLFTVNLATMEKYLLQIPNMPLDWWWLEPSWR